MIRTGLLFFLQLVIFVVLIGPVFASLVFMFTKGCLEKSLLFIDLPSFIIILVSFLILGMGSGVKDFFAGYERARKRCVDSKGIKMSLASIAAFRKIIINWSVIGFLIGAVIMMSCLDDLSAIHRGFSAATITIYYGIAFILIFCLPLEMRLKLRLAELDA